MKAVIMAAGKSTRTFPLTVHTPKSMLPILNKPLLEYTLSSMHGLVDEFILIIGFEKDQIESYFGHSFQGTPIRYVEQTEKYGTGGALLCAKPFLTDRFIVLNGDDMFCRHDIEMVMKHRYGVLAKKVADPDRFGIFRLDQKGFVKEIVEKPQEHIGDLANIGVYVFDTDVFYHDLKSSSRGEYEVTDYLNYLALQNKVHVEVASDWIPLTYPWNLLEANVEYLKRIKESSIHGTIEEGAAIKGILHLGKGSIIKSGSCIEGPVFIGDNSEIGPLAHIRPNTIIRNNVRIGKTETVDSVWMDNTTAKHNGYIGHSVIGRNVNIGAGTITADFRHDGKNHTTVINNDKVDTRRRKLGVFIGDGVNTGIGTLIYPGRKLWPYTCTLPGEIVMKDKVK